MLSKARRALRRDPPKRDKAAEFLIEARQRYAEDLAWRQRAKAELLAELSEYDEAIQHSIGLRVQRWLTSDQARVIARCQSVHRNLLLHF